MDVDRYGLDLYGCRGPLNDPGALADALRAAAARVGATPLTEARATFQPHGVTVVLVLAESHMIVATWPEHGLALFDVLLCNPAMDPEAAAALVVEVLRPERTRPWRVTHRVGPEPPP